MTAWIVTVDSRPGLPADEDVLLAFSDSLDDLRGSTGAAASLDGREGVLGATFTVEAENVQGAVDHAVSIFDAALERVGIAGGNVARVDAEEIAEREPAFA